MPKMTAWRRGLGKRGLASFTLVELLVVMGIIAILAAMILYAGSAVITKGLRSRTTGEIQAMSTALEGYKTDNGAYPSAAGITGGTTAAYPYDPTASGGVYQVASQTLFMALTGKTNFTDTPIAGTKTYFTSLTANQVGNATTAAGTAYSATTASYIRDPWKNAYGYSTGDGSTSNVPVNGSGFFDLWSTVGQTTSSTNGWIGNW